MNPVNGGGRYRAWRVQSLGRLTLESCALPEPRAGSALVRMEAVPLLSYLGAYIRGELSDSYIYPPMPFTPGTNGIGTIEAVGSGVYHLKPGMRVFVSPYLVVDEIVDEPAQMLIGLTGMGNAALLSDWPDGTLAQYSLVPASVLVPIDGLEKFRPTQLATFGKLAVPLGGLLRGRLVAGERLLVHGATGYFGSAAVLLGAAMGATRIIAVGRDTKTLDDLRVISERVVPVRLFGNVQADVENIQNAAGGKPDIAFDMVGQADDARGTLAALTSLRRGGRLIMMGSASVPLPVDYNQILANNWEIIGNFMYSADALATLARLVQGDMLNLDVVRLKTFSFESLPDAINAAAAMRGLDCTVLEVR